MAIQLNKPLERVMALIVQKPEGRIILTVDNVYLSTQYHITKGTLEKLEWSRVTNSLLAMNKVSEDDTIKFAFDCERYIKNLSADVDRRNLYFTCALITKSGWTEDDRLTEEGKCPFVGLIPFVSPIFITDDSAMLSMLKIIIDINLNNEYTIDKDVRLNIFEEWRAHAITPYDYDHRDLVINNQDATGGWSYNFNYRKDKASVPSDKALFSQYKTKTLENTYKSFQNWSVNNEYSIGNGYGASTEEKKARVSTNLWTTSTGKLSRNIFINHHNVEQMLNFLMGGTINNMYLPLTDMARYTRLLQSYPRGLQILTICPLKFSKSAYFLFSSTNGNYRSDAFYVDFESIEGFTDKDWDIFISSLETGVNSSVIQMYYENFYISINNKLFYVWKTMFDEDVPHTTNGGINLYSWFECTLAKQVNHNDYILLPEFSDLGHWYFSIVTDYSITTTLLGEKRINMSNFSGDEYIPEAELDRFSYIQETENGNVYESSTLFSQKSFEEIMNTYLKSGEVLVDADGMKYGVYNNAIYNYVVAYMILQEVYRKLAKEPYIHSKTMLGDICLVCSYEEEVYTSENETVTSPIYRIIPYAPIYHAEGIDYFDVVPMGNALSHKLFVNGNILRIVYEVEEGQRKNRIDDYDMSGRLLGQKIFDAYNEDGNKKNIVSWRGTSITITNNTISLGIN